MEDWILEREFVLWLGTHRDEPRAPDEAIGKAASDGQRTARSRRRDIDVGEELLELR